MAQVTHGKPTPAVVSVNVDTTGSMGQVSPRIAVRERTLALLDAAIGLRVSELLALRWCDVDFENLEL